MKYHCPQLVKRYPPVSPLADEGTLTHTHKDVGLISLKAWLVLGKLELSGLCQEEVSSPVVAPA